MGFLSKRVVSCITFAILSAVGALCIPQVIAAQDVRGTVRDAASRSPVSGAFVELLSSSGERAVATVANEGGAFALRAPNSGEFSLRVERIGYAPWTSRVFQVPMTGTTLDIEMELRPIALVELAVTAAGQCPGELEELLEARAFYDQAIEALQPLVWAEARDLHVFQVVVSESGPDKAPGGQVVTAELLDRLPPPDRPRKVAGKDGPRYAVLPAPPDTVLLRQPIATAEPHLLDAFGFVQPWDIGLQYLAPTPATLASAEFRASHCFSVRRHPSEPWMGLGFQPLPGREVPDVEGTLWLDEDSNPRRIEFAFTRLREALDEHEVPLLRAHIRERVGQVPTMAGFRLVLGGISMEGDWGGQLDFEQLSQGLWITRRWELRVPILWYELTWFRGSHPEVTGRPIAMERRRSGRVTAVLAPSSVSDTITPPDHDRD